MGDVIKLLHQSTVDSPQWGKAWHNWALFNVAALNHFTRGPEGQPRDVSEDEMHHLSSTYVTAAIRGFFQSIALAQSAPADARPHGPARGAGALQDILRLLTLWFNHGSTPEVQRALQEGFLSVRVETWLAVIPQIIARIHTNIQARWVERCCNWCEGEKCGKAMSQDAGCWFAWLRQRQTVGNTHGGVATMALS